VLPDGQIDGNIIVTPDGRQHELDTHPQGSFDQRIKDYVIGTNLIALRTPQEIAQGRKQTLVALREILRKKGATPFALVGRFGTPLTEDQVLQLRDWLTKLKERAANN
jgi:hypothetical protein